MSEEKFVLDKEVKKLWLEALRSGDYQQGNGWLRTTQNKFCCLGVLVDCALDGEWLKGRGAYNGTYEFIPSGRPEGVVEFKTDSTSGRGAALSPPRRQYFGRIPVSIIPDDVQTKLVGFNDGVYEGGIAQQPKSFNEIADWIEENL